MAKLSGGNRTLKPGSKNYRDRLIAYHEELGTNGYSESYFSEKSGGYMLVVDSEQGRYPEEIECAKLLADKGYIITLYDEGGSGVTPDGEIFSFTYEQRTPDKAEGAHGVCKCIEHAREKIQKGAKVDVALIFDKYNRFSKNDVVEGIKEYEKYNRARFKQIIVVSSSGRVHRHKHND